MSAPTTTTTPKAGEAGDIPTSLKREPTKKYDFHPTPDLFPLLDGPSFDALVDDIKEHGQLEPVRLFDGKILDGRNRYLACQQLNREVRALDYLGDNPIGFVLGVNLHRRHLDESQR